ncbi:CDP-diacylglycerol-glycerol-3-phosphate 3-phosphatidyltransferase 2-like [Micractinium conductrix]|uniref:CDP-diacylglycerol-glycerol-3-phosphate 3-phosphatidyltransferase 2-like n=1 Tax=Micractinium conductrix TaxID=554055 RepID=A0A2P6VSF2_9CHLO|nr:CDP-diacylglycerol-glycerol-3-phosphate 3-phosphatidyltransferase 2-like [Micractinium conductrix]|eukprot:PSC76980.1 CDP-diacylglycerol-glycerol-3-phosphate 3-phosphatidyltransferase 2-like [Micractinium conductrix]
MLASSGRCLVTAELRPAPAAAAAPAAARRRRAPASAAQRATALPALQPPKHQQHAPLLGLQQQQIQQRRPRIAPVAAASSGGGSSSKSTTFTLPTLLTLARVAAIPALVAAWYSAAPWAPAACTALFVGASLTDYLDGYLARKLDASSAFGAFLDPVADKLMVATVMILMCTRPLPAGLAAGNTWLMPLVTCVVIGREITMSALREWAAALGPEAHSAVAVSWVGKWKTAAQMTSLTLLLLARQGPAAGGAVPPAALAAAGATGVPLLLVAALLTVWSLALYFAGLWRFF